MSASEKLKALNEAIIPQGATPMPWAALRNALPQIVEVVEAAEQFDFPSVTGEAWQDISAALAALDEALA